MHAYLRLMSLALGYSLPGPTSWTERCSLSNPPRPLPHPHAAHMLVVVGGGAGGGLFFTPPFHWRGGRGGDTVPALSLGDSGVTEHGVPRPPPPFSLLAASAPHPPPHPPTAPRPPIAAASLFFSFAGATINAELIKPQLIASAGEREGDTEEGGRERKAEQLQRRRLTDGRTDRRMGFGWPTPLHPPSPDSLARHAQPPLGGRRGFALYSVVYFIRCSFGLVR